MRKRFSEVIRYFEQQMPAAETELVYHDPFQLLVAVILSAQCTDKRVNQITPAFFYRFPDCNSLAAAGEQEIFELIRSCSYPNNKSKHLRAMAGMLVRDYGGMVPDTVEELQKLPGVGRKTANVIASVVFNQPAMAVDTHVFRVAARIGLTQNSRTPLETERQLVRYIPADKISVAHHWLILHGRYICTARKPRCSECGLRELCVFYLKQTT